MHHDHIGRGFLENGHVKPYRQIAVMGTSISIVGTAKNTCIECYLHSQLVVCSDSQNFSYTYLLLKNIKLKYWIMMWFP